MSIRDKRIDPEDIHLGLLGRRISRIDSVIRPSEVVRIRRLGSGASRLGQLDKGRNRLRNDPPAIGEVSILHLVKITAGACGIVEDVDQGERVGEVAVDIHLPKFIQLHIGSQRAAVQEHDLIADELISLLNNSIIGPILQA